VITKLSLSGILSLLVVGAVVGTAFYYRGNIKNAFGDNRSKEEKDYDFDRKKKEDNEWDESGWNPDNWGLDNWFPSKDNSKIDTKQQGTENLIDIQISDNMNNSSNNNRYNKGNRRFN